MNAFSRTLSFARSAPQSIKKGTTPLWLKRYGELILALISGVFILTAWMIESTWMPAAIAIYLISYGVGGFVKAKQGLYTLFKEHDLDVNLLMLIAAIGAASIGFWTEGAVLIFIFALSGALETYSIERSHRDISALMDLKPEMAVRVANGIETIVSIESLQIGDIVIVKPGERIPADGVIQSGSSAVNQASITGESVPVDKTPGGEVFAGTLNGQGALFIQVSKSSESTLFAKIIKLVQEAQSEKPVSQLFIEKFERIYARSILLITGLLILAPPFILSWNWTDSLYKAMVFLVVASPCALVASIMPVMLSAISNGARKGILFKGGAHLENIAHTKVIAFDKTGTLTQGSPTVTDIIACSDYNEQEVLLAAASLESLSEHPLAAAIVQEAAARQLLIDRPLNLQAVTGSGIEAEFRGEWWRIGKPSFMDDPIIHDQCATVVRELQEKGKTVVVMQNSTSLVGIIALQDQIRPQAKKTIHDLHQLGIKVAMLTGDQQLTADAIAKEADIDMVFAELMPEEKVKKIQILKEQYGKVVMVGDGVNDAPALATATVGIAMGITGSDVALETADLVLMNDEIEHISTAIRLGKRVEKVIKQNIIFALSVIVILVAANFLEGIYLPFGVVGHESSTLLVILNGLRLLR